MFLQCLIILKIIILLHAKTYYNEWCKILKNVKALVKQLPPLWIVIKWFNRFDLYNWIEKYCILGLSNKHSCILITTVTVYKLYTYS